MVKFPSNGEILAQDTAPPPPDSEISSTSPRESGSASSPTGPFLPHLNLRAAAAASHHGSHPVPRKMPRSDLNLMHVGPSHYSNTGAQLSLMNTNRWDTDDYMEDFSPPHKRAKLPISSAASSSSGSSSHTMNTNISVESGDETYYYESDSETALSPYGPSANSLHRLLGAVENVLTEEREMAMTLAQLEAMRTMIDSVEETRKRTLGKLEAALVHQLSAIQGLASSECVQATIAEKQRAQEEVARATAAAANPAPTDSPTAPPTTPAVPATTTSLDSTKVPSPEKPAESDAKMYVDSAPPTADAQPIAPTPEHKPVEKEVPSAPAPQPAPTLEQELPKIVESQFQLEVAEAQVEQIMGPLRDQHHSILAPSMTLPLQLLSVLPPELEAAAVDLSSVFANATLLQLGSQADVEAFKQFFVQSLAQSKVRINQEVAVLFETLGALKVRQTQLGQNTFIDQIQLRNLSTDLHELKQRVVHASRAVQNAFVQLVSQFSEQIETAKRIYQESAGNNVKLLDEIIRAQLTPQLTSQVDLLKRQLLAHVNCVRANLAYLDTLVLNTE